MIRYPDHLHALLEPTSVTSSCDNSHSQGMGLGIIVVAGTRLNLPGCRQRSRFSRRFIIHWEGRSIYKKLFTFFLQRQETSLWFQHHTSQALPGTRPTRLSLPIDSLYVPQLLTCFITRILTLSASHLVASRRISGYAPLRSPCTTPTPLHSLLGNSDAKFPDSDPLRRNSGSGSRHVSPAPTCPRPLARSTLEHDCTLR